MLVLSVTQQREGLFDVAVDLSKMLGSEVWLSLLLWLSLMFWLSLSFCS